MRAPSRRARLIALVGVLLLACSGGAYAASAPPSTSSTPATPSTPAEAARAAEAPAAPIAAFAAELRLDAPVASAPPEQQVERPPVVVLDPGHAVDEVGASANGVAEKASNLDMAFRVAAILREQGVRALMARTDDERAFVTDPPLFGYNATRTDLQARVDLANAAEADVFVSIHSNGIGDPSVRGVEAYYNSQRPFAADNRLLATLLLDRVIDEMHAAGYPARRRGVIDDACLKAFQGRCFPLFVLGPVRITGRDEVYRRGGDPAALGFTPGVDALPSRATQMPGALIELLFISSPADAAWLRDDAARDAMARGLARGIMEFLGRVPGG